jgi:hypothetical protein
MMLELSSTGATTRAILILVMVTPVKSKRQLVTVVSLVIMTG